MSLRDQDFCHSLQRSPVWQKHSCFEHGLEGVELRFKGNHLPGGKALSSPRHRGQTWRIWERNPVLEYIEDAGVKMLRRESHDCLGSSVLQASRINSQGVDRCPIGVPHLGLRRLHVPAAALAWVCRNCSGSLCSPTRARPSAVAHNTAKQPWRLGVPLPAARAPDLPRVRVALGDCAPPTTRRSPR